MCGHASCSYGVDNAAADVHVGKGFVWQRTSEGDIPLLPLADVQLQGRHMLSNVVAATTISHLAGASGESLARALDGFHGLEHVMELVATRGGVRFVNDSKATNVDAAAKSIESFDHVVAIIGGKYKGGDFADLAEPLRAHGRAVVAIGEARPLVTARAEGCRAGDRSRLARGSGPAGDGIWRCPMAWCCWRRPVRASTCSPTTRIADGSSRRRCKRLISAGA